MKLIQKLFSLLAIVTLCGSVVNAMGEGGDESREKIPRFSELQRSKPSYVGTVVDNGHERRVNQISFTGDTVLHGLQSESNDSRVQLNLGEILAIEVLNPTYQSEKFSQEFTLVKIIPKKQVGGEHIAVELLAPRNVQFSAKDSDTGLEHAWWLRDIKQLKIDNPQPLQQNGSKRD